MRLRLKAMQDTVESVRGRNAETECRNRVLVDRLSKYKSRVAQAREKFGEHVGEFFDELDDANRLLELEQHHEKTYDYLKEIEDLK